MFLFINVFLIINKIYKKEAPLQSQIMVTVYLCKSVNTDFSLLGDNFIMLFKLKQTSVSGHSFC